ncbi:MAG: bifunctional DNA-formamidopyrimidine glycosylase/DNA-(apurinic or apyrimidinic site) lyase [Candidatus Paceibacterota bacterium]
MPELPEVQTTASMLNSLVKNKIILDVWTDYNSPYYKGKNNIKDPDFFKKFKKEVSNKKIVKVWRRAKNVLIDIEGNKTILIHMKMTGHLLYGTYKSVGKRSGLKNLKRPDLEETDLQWIPIEPETLKDPFSRFIHLVFILENGKHIAFSDMRKFATVTLISDKKALSKQFEKVGPEPLENNFDWKILKERLLKKPSGKIKTVLMDTSVVAGIGNIYSDEILWASKIHPERKVSSLTDLDIKEILKWIKKLLLKGIDFGGDSMSDYRNPLGEKGDFQNHHSAYRRTGKPCLRKGCEGKIVRKKIGGRSAHFCDTCQKK